MKNIQDESKFSNCAIRKRHYSIVATELFSDHETEICQVENAPENVVAALKRKTLGLKRRISQYHNIRIVDNWANQ